MAPKIIPLDIKLPRGAKSAIVQIELEPGNILVSDKAKLIDNNLHQFQLDEDDIEQGTASLEVAIKNSDNMSGKSTTSLQIIATSRQNHLDYDINQLTSDISKGLGIISDEIILEWDVYQIAKKPEVKIDAQDGESSLKYVADTQQLIIPYRNGINSQGKRNFNEEFMIKISGIPDGFTLAQKKGNNYIACGATDPFGTTTLISIGNTERNISKLDEYSVLFNGNLYLVAKEEILAEELVADSLKIAISASIAASDTISMNTSSEELNTTLDIEKTSGYEYIKLTQVPQYIDPLIISLREDGKIPLISPQSSNVAFRMLPDFDKLKTGWIRNHTESYDSGFLIFDNNVSTDNDINISSITQLFSEYFQASSSKRSFNTGIEALRSLDTNDDKKITKDDTQWNNIGIWFDDGDTISQKHEIVPLSKYVEEIDLKNTVTFDQEVDWSDSNRVLREVKAFKEDKIYSLYDVGLNIDLGTSEELIPLQISNSVLLEEQGDIMSISITSKGSDVWKEDGRDLLTLVRISGIPDEIVPTIGTQDRRGDWIFTWSDLRKNSNKLGLIPDSDWSGDANIKVVISQVQQNGSISSSSIESTALNVQAIADKPILILNNINTEEDSLIRLSDIYNRMIIRDQDGSEVIHFELSSLPDGVKLIDLVTGNTKEKDSFKDAYILRPDEILNFALEPLVNSSGIKEFDWKTVSTEISNEDTVSSVNKATIYIEPKADKPDGIILKSNMPVLIEGGNIDLKKVLEIKSIDEYLVDDDGSEELLVKLIVPKGLELNHRSDESWVPFQAKIEQTTRNGHYEVYYKDLSELNLIDRGIDPSQEVKLKITSISREIRNSDTSFGEEKTAIIAYERNARPATIKLHTPEKRIEDLEGWKLGDLFSIQPDNINDKVLLKLSQIPEQLILVDPSGKEIKKSQVDIPLENINEWEIKGSTNISGSFSLEYQAESQPNGNGESATTFTEIVVITIEPRADTPSLDIKEDALAVNVSNTGWIDLGQIVDDLGSVDNDGSEKFYVKVEFLDRENRTIELLEGAILNTQFFTVQDESWIIRKSEVEELKIYVGGVEEEIQIKLTPISQDGSDEINGESKTVRILPNNIIRAPILDISRGLQGDEDTTIPLLQENGGIIKVSQRGNSLNSNLELEVKNLPNGVEIIKKILNTDGSTSYTSALNRDENGNIVTRLRLNYIQWQDVYLKGAQDVAGDFDFVVQAFTVKDSGQEQSTKEQRVDLIINPINDKPKIVNTSDLSPINEGELGNWDISSKFADVDNLNTELRFTAQVVSNDNKTHDLPMWLTMSDNGVLSGLPMNNDVGQLNILVTATDPLGMQTKGVFFLSVGNINNPPLVNHNLDLLAEWKRGDDDEQNKYSKSIFLRDFVEIKLLSDENNGNMNGLFIDPDSLHEEQAISFSLSVNHSDWSNEISDIAEIYDNKLVINPTSKAVVGQQLILVKATDATGASTILYLDLNILNVNDPPLVIRESAIQVGTQQWKEYLDIAEGDSSWRFNPGVIFSDIDANDRLDILKPVNFPAWMIVEDDGTLRGTPTNNDVGELELTWRALDRSGENAYYTLNINVENTNTAPIVNSDIEKIIGTEDEYSQIDLNEIFSDSDSIHGDRLRFEYKLLNSKSEEVDSFDWLKINNTSNESVDFTNKLLLKPVMYRIDDEGQLGDIIQSDEIASLSPNTKARIIIEATDNREVDMKGLIGIDIDIIWSPNIQLEGNTEKITDQLPLFNTIEQKRNGMRVKAGSAPDGFNVGGMVGDIENEKVVSFDIILLDPKSTNSISVTPGTGLERDGILDRYANILDENNSVVNSLSTNNSGLLEILSPPNDSVGSYELILTAIDQYNKSSNTSIELKIRNTNDSPYINSEAYTALKNYFEQKNSEASAVDEGLRVDLNPINLFGDDDLLHKRISKEKLDIKLVENSDNTLDAFKMSSESDGSIRLSINAPKGLIDFVEQSIRLEAVDSKGEMITTDWFNIIFRPVAEPTLLTTGIEQRPLKSIELGYSGRKNTIIDIDNLLDINAIKLNDQQGDEAIFKIKVPFEDTLLYFKGLESSVIVKKETRVDGSEFSIDLNLLANKSNRELGDLSGLELKIPDNQLLLLPIELTNDKESGIPIEIWTETRVKGDYAPKFNIAQIEPSKVWIELTNNSPMFNQSVAKKLDATIDSPINLDENRVLFKLEKMVIDQDQNDFKVFSVEIPENLIDYIFFDLQSGEIRIRPEVSSYAELPQGIHQIGVRVRDSSGIVGDPTGFNSRNLQLVILGDEESNETTLGLNLMHTIKPSKISQLLKRDEDKFEEGDKEIKSILKSLNVIPDLIEKDNMSQEAIENAISFVEKLQRGTLTVLQKVNEEDNLFILEASDSDDVLINAELQNANKKVVSKTSKLLDINSDVSISTPIGELDFLVDTQARDISVVNLQIPENTEINALIKTVSDGTPYVFNTEFLSFNGDEDLDSWLEQISYGIYYYSEDKKNRDDQVIDIIPGQQSLAYSLIENGFQTDIIPSIDGSGYLIDTDNDGKANVISLMLVDQGWFDTRQDTIGLIGDPLTPISLRTGSEESVDPDSSDPSIENPTEPSSNADADPSTQSGNTNQLQFSRQLSNNRQNVNNLKVDALRNEIFNVENKTQSIYLRNQNKERINNSSRVSSGYNSASTSQDIGSSQDSNNQDQIPTQEFFDMGQDGFEIKNWLQDKGRQIRDFFDKSVGYFLENEQENGVPSVLAMLFVPLAAERVATTILKSVKQPKELKLVRKNSEFNGSWLMAAKEGKYMIIEKSRNLLTIRNIDNSSFDLNMDRCEVLPGFKNSGESFLYNALQKSDNQGSVISAIEIAYLQLQMHSEADINWLDWLDKNLGPQKGTKLWEMRAKRTESIDRLYELLNHASNEDPTLADIIMLGQLQDCCDKLGLHRLIEGSLHKQYRGG